MENTQNSSNNELKFSEYVSLVGPFIIFLGMARLITFYNSFGISITSYLEFSEIITSFFDIILLLVLFFAYTSIQNYIMSDKEKLQKVTAKRQEILDEVKPLKIWWLYIKYLSTLLLIGIVVIIGGIISHYWFNSVTTWIISFMSMCFGFLLFFIVISIEVERKHLHFNSSIKKKRFMYFTLHAIVLTSFVTFYALFQASAIKNDKTTNGVTIFLDDGRKINSDSTNYYIGKTHDYLFIYNEKNKTTDVYPMSKIKQMTMIHKPKN